MQEMVTSVMMPMMMIRSSPPPIHLPYHTPSLPPPSPPSTPFPQVPDIAEANHREPLLPWGGYNQGAIVLGATVESACATPTDLAHASALFAKERYVMTYRPDTKKVGGVQREGRGRLWGMGGCGRQARGTSSMVAK
jgi:hypothetical protein